MLPVIGAEGSTQTRYLRKCIQSHHLDSFHRHPQSCSIKQLQHIIYRLVKTTERDRECLIFLFMIQSAHICPVQRVIHVNCQKTVTWSTSKPKSWLCLTSCSLKAALLISPPKNIFCQSRSVMQPAGLVPFITLAWKTCAPCELKLLRRSAVGDDFGKNVKEMWKTENMKPAE